MPYNSVRSCDESAVLLSRRSFLGGLGLAAAAVRLPSDVLAVTDDEAYWRQIKRQFPLRPGFILMNAANLCPSPIQVSDAVKAHTRDIDADASFQNRDKYAGFLEHAQGRLARYMGADADEIAIVRNTTEGNNQVVSGLDLGPEDEVVLWDENHPSNNLSWNVAARRRGFAVRRVTTPPSPAGAQQLFAAFADAVTDRTRVLSFSHVSNVTGVALPAAELCAFARERNILTLIDGAQTFGVHEVDLYAIGCDFYTGSAHKWFLGPKEGGLLYVRRDSARRLWPNVVGVGWSEHLEGARRFGTLGQRDDAMYTAMGQTIDFLESIGNTRIESRVRSLASALKKGLLASVDGAVLVTPAEEALSGGVVVFSVAEWDHAAVFQNLYEDHHIGAALIGPDRLRLCPHVYNTMADVEQVVDVLAAI